MQYLVGKHFVLNEVDYAIVDVRNIEGDSMVYAEPVQADKGPGRAAFRYADIASSLAAVE